MPLCFHSNACVPSCGLLDSNTICLMSFPTTYCELLVDRVSGFVSVQCQGQRLGPKQRFAQVK